MMDRVEEKVIRFGGYRYSHNLYIKYVPVWTSMYPWSDRPFRSVRIPSCLHWGEV